MRLIRLAKLYERARETILSELRTSTHTGDIAFMLLVLGGYARRGDPEATRVLREHALTGDDWPQQILAHTGDANLEWLIENVLPGLLQENGNTYQWIRRNEFPGSSPIRKRLRALLKADDARREAVGQPTNGLISSEVLDQLRAGSRPTVNWNAFRREATDDEYRELIEAWLADPLCPFFQSFFWVLRHRPFPLPFERLLPIADTQEGRRLLDHLLGKMRNSGAREYALRRLEERPIPFGTLFPLRRSFQTGDEAAIRAVLTQLATQDELSRDGVIQGILDLMEEHEGDWQPIAEWIYEHVDDSWEHRRAVEWMAKCGVLPEAIRDEGVDDAEPAIRRICRAARRNA